MADDYSVETEWNSNMVMIRILAELRAKIIEAGLNKNFDAYFDNLEAYWVQLQSVVNKDEDLMLNELLLAEARVGRDIIKKLVAEGMGKIPNNLIIPFKVCEKQLYRTQQKYNLGMSLKEDPRLAAMKT